MAVLYLLDANTLIDANRDYYGIGQVDEYWEWLVHCGKACKDDPLGGKSASSLTHLVWLQKLLFVVQRWKGKRG